MQPLIENRMENYYFTAFSIITKFIIILNKFIYLYRFFFFIALPCASTAGGDERRKMNPVQQIKIQVSMAELHVSWSNTLLFSLYVADTVYSSALLQKKGGRGSLHFQTRAAQTKLNPHATVW